MPHLELDHSDVRFEWLLYGDAVWTDMEMPYLKPDRSGVRLDCNLIKNDV